MKTASLVCFLLYKPIDRARVYHPPLRESRTGEHCSPQACTGEHCSPQVYIWRALLATGIYGERCSPVRIRANRLEGRMVTARDGAVYARHDERGEAEPKDLRDLLKRYWHSQNRITACEQKILDSIMETGLKYNQWNVAFQLQYGGECCGETEARKRK